MRARDLLRIEWVADPRISPDGSRIAFTRVAVDAEADAYVTGIWMVEVDRPDRPRRLTSGRNDAQPRWSPDGRRIAFVRKGPGSEDVPQLHVLPLDGGEATALTSLAKGASSPAWSPDGTRIAFLSGTHPALDDPKPEKPRNEPARIVTRPEFRLDNEGFFDFEHPDHVWIVNTAGGEPRQLTTGRFKEGPPRWSRDGRRILFLSDRREEPWFGQEDVGLFAVAPDLESPTDGAALETIADIHGPIRDFVEGPDGRIAVIGGVRGDVFHSYDQDDVLVLEGPVPRTMPRSLTADFDFPVGETLSSDQHPPRGGGALPFGFAADGRSVLAVATRHGSAVVVRIPDRGGRVERLTDEGRDIACGSVTPDGRRIALTLGGLDRPGDLHVLDTKTGALTRLWSPNDALLAEQAAGDVETFWYPSFDGREIQAWLVKPPDFDPSKRWPLVLQIHGGPHVAYGFSFFHEFRVLAAAGYLVLYTNPRGSTSYGHEFADCIQYRFPGDDARDLMAGVEAVLERGYVDEKRIGVTGGSGGGLLTNWLITHTHRFAAAVTQRCVSDWAGMYHGADFAMFTPFWFRKPPHEDPQEWIERSPLFLASRITTPLMIVHSETDWRTPIVQGEAMFRALKHQRKPVVMVRFPGEGHELSRSGVPSRRVENVRHIRRWFDRWLMGKETPEYGV